jgi:hypothetical protein
MRWRQIESVRSPQMQFPVTYHPPGIYVVYELGRQGVFEFQIIHPENNINM